MKTYKILIVNINEIFKEMKEKSASAIFKGTLMQILKSPYIF